MKTLYSFILALPFLYFSCEKENKPCGLTENTDTSPQIYKVLFIGNSHTYGNKMPETIASIAKSKGDSISFRMEAPGGCTFKRHSSREKTLEAIDAEKWDFVILQGQGGKQALPTYMADTAIYQYGQILVDKIKANYADTKIILYMTHAYNEGVLTWGDTEWCEKDPLVCDYAGMQKRVKDNYVEMSKIFEAEVAPCGMIWKFLLDKFPDINLFQSDGVHANTDGSYISACAIYSLIFKKRPHQIYVPMNVTAYYEIEIQNLVSEVLFDCNPNWKNY